MGDVLIFFVSGFVMVIFFLFFCFFSFGFLHLIEMYCNGEGATEGCNNLQQFNLACNFFKAFKL